MAQREAEMRLRTLPKYRQPIGQTGELYYVEKIVRLYVKAGSLQLVRSYAERAKIKQAHRAMACKYINPDMPAHEAREVLQRFRFELVDKVRASKALPRDVPVAEDPLAPITRLQARLLRAKLLRILRWANADDWAASVAIRKHLKCAADDAIVLGAPIGGVARILRTYGMPKPEMAAPVADWEHAVRVVAGQFVGISAEQAVTKAVEALPSVLSKRELRQQMDRWVRFQHA